MGPQVEDQFLRVFNTLKIFSNWGIIGCLVLCCRPLSLSVFNFSLLYILPLDLYGLFQDLCDSFSIPCGTYLLSPFI